MLSYNEFLLTEMKKGSIRKFAGNLFASVMVGSAAANIANDISKYIEKIEKNNSPYKKLLSYATPHPITKRMTIDYANLSPDEEKHVNSLYDQLHARSRRMVQQPKILELQPTPAGERHARWMAQQPKNLGLQPKK